MSILKFSDGTSFDTSGEPRIENREDGLYVLGNGFMIPVNNRTEGNQHLTQISKDVMEGHDDQLTNNILYGCLRSNFINVNEANDSSIRDEAYSIACDHHDDEEIGSSDMTFIKKEFLDSIGKKTDFVKGYLTLID